MEQNRLVIEWRPTNVGPQLYMPIEAVRRRGVEPDWLMRHVDEGLFPHAVSVAGVWRFSSASLLRARRMRQLERDFDAIPELAALVADLLEEMDDLQARMR